MTQRTRETTEVRQQQISEAALLVIGQKGLNGATTSEIAAAAGISEGNLYRHFKNKEEIIKSVISRIGTELVIILDSVQELPDALQKLAAVFAQHLAFLEEHVGIPRTIFSEETLVVNENLRAQVRSVIAAYSQGLNEIIMQGQKDGLVDERMDSHVIVGMFIGTIHFAVTRWMMSNFMVKLTDETEVLWRNLARGIVQKKD